MTETNQSMSELVNDALKASLQEERKGEDTYDYEEFVELLKKDGVL